MDSFDFLQIDEFDFMFVPQEVLDEFNSIEEPAPFQNTSETTLNQLLSFIQILSLVQERKETLWSNNSRDVRP